MSRLPLRVRLVAGFSAAMLVLLVAAGAFVYWRVEYALDRGLDTELASATAVIEPLVGTDGTVRPREAADATGAGWQVLDEGGRVLDSGGPAPRAALVPADRLDDVSGTATIDEGSVLPIADAPYRLRVSELSGGTPAFLVVGVRADHRDEALRELLAQLTAAGLGALVIASLVGFLLARSALRPVERYRRRAAEIAAGGSDLRLDVPTGRDDEVTRLGHTLNDMLAAQERALERERRFVNDASHELRTPLTLLKSRIQLARRRPRSVEEHEGVLAELEVDLTRLSVLADELLDLSRSPTATDAVTDVGRVAGGVAARWVAPVEARTEHAPVRIDPTAAERVVTNLVTNAFTHGRAPVSVTVRRTGRHVVLEVVDAGPGMPPELLAEATRRFTRAPEARSRPGAGLGLAIVEQLVIDAGGELRLCHAGAHASTSAATAVPCQHDDRMTVTVLLPAVPD